MSSDSDDSSDASYRSTWRFPVPRDIPQKFREIRRRIDNLYRGTDDHEAAFRALRDEHRALFEARRVLNARTNTLLRAIKFQEDAESY